MITPTFTAVVERGVLRADVGYYKWLASLEGQRVEAIVRKKRKQRSTQQNKYYWSVIIGILADFCGYDPEGMHEALKEKFLGSERDSHGLKKIRSTTDLTTDEFISYTNQVVIWAAQNLSVYIPGPNECEY